jgi:hypothetical protein
MFQRIKIKGKWLSVLIAKMLSLNATRGSALLVMQPITLNAGNRTIKCAAFMDAKYAMKRRF